MAEVLPVIDYVVSRHSTGTAYRCVRCGFLYLRGRGSGDAASAHERAVAAIARHVEESHLA